MQTARTTDVSFPLLCICVYFCCHLNTDLDAFKKSNLPKSFFVWYNLTVADITKLHCFSTEKIEILYNAVYNTIRIECAV